MFLGNLNKGKKDRMQRIFLDTLNKENDDFGRVFD